MRMCRRSNSLNGVINTTAWSIATFVGTASDPLVTVTAGSNIPAEQIHIPLNAAPTAGDDRTMVFYDQTQPGKVFCYWDVNFNNGTNVAGGLNAGFGATFDTTGDGFSAPSWNPGQMDYDYNAGVINNYDLANGAIDHALRITLSDEAEKMPPGSNYFTTNIPWPDDHVDYNGPTAYTGNIVAGSTFGIPKSVNINNLGLSAGGLMLAKALQNYGAIWKDSGGSDQFTVFADPTTANNPLMQEMAGDISKIMPVLSVMRNQGPNSVNGGGTYPAPPPPFDPSLGIGSGEAPGYTGSGGSTGTSGGGSTGAATPSPNDTVIKPGQGTLTDASGNVWAITNAGSITENGTIDAYSYGVAEMAYINNTVYQETGSGAWYSEPASPGWWTSATDPLPATSPNDTVIKPAQGTITDASGNVWAITNAGSITENGTIDAYSYNVAEMAYVNNTVYEETSSGTWYSEPSTPGWWTPATDPLPAAPTLGVTAPSASMTSYQGLPAKVTGVTLSDSAPSETATLSIKASSGVLKMTAATGANAVSGSGTAAISVSDKVANLTADLASLTYSGTAVGSATLSFGLTDAAGAAASATATDVVSADTIKLTLSEDAYLGNANFIAKVDGVQVGGPTAVTASHGAGATQSFTYSGNWGSGVHSVEVDFTNDAYGGSATKDRNLYVNQVAYNGANAMTSSHALYGNGAFVVHVGS